jgi:hypothetical protein
MAVGVPPTVHCWTFAGAGEPDVASYMVEQAQPGCLFQRRDAAAEGQLRQECTTRRKRKMEFVGEQHESQATCNSTSSNTAAT